MPIDVQRLYRAEREALLAYLARRAGLLEPAAAMATLSPGTRDAVRLRVVDELSYRDLAARLGISEAAARVRVSRGLSALAVEMRA